ncbi:MAG: phage tail tube protein [Butyricicoccus sp.]
MNAQTMNAKDCVSAALAECYVTIEDTRYLFMQAINVEATIKKNKSTVPILGRTGKGHKSTGWEGTGSATFHYNTSVFRSLLKRYKETGEDVYFDMQLTNEDPTSSVGSQTVNLIDCNLDGGTLAKFDASKSDYLDESFDFTFEDFEIPEEFTLLDGMV